MTQHPTPTFRTLLFLISLACLLGARFPRVSAATTPSLELQLVKQAPKIIKRLEEVKCRNVGVLKCLVSMGGSPLSDDVGSLNVTFCQKVELALALANNPRNPIGIVQDANAVAATVPGSNYLSQTGRAKLFDAKYPLVWGRRKVSVDVFLTGWISVSKDLKKLTVNVMGFDRKTNKMLPFIPPFVAANDPNKLSELGESFVLRSSLVKVSHEPGKREGLNQAMIGQASLVRQNKQPHPLQDKNAPVKLTVLYDKKPVKIEYREGNAFVPAPTMGQKVAIRLEREKNDKRYAVVLKVNGESTIRRQKLPADQCSAWVLLPETSAMTIAGYQIDNERAMEFRVLPPEESKAMEVNYGEHAGMITLTVFGEAEPSRPVIVIDDDLEKAMAVERAQLPETKPESSHALVAQLLKMANRGRGRGGLIGQGEAVESEVRQIRFHRSSNPIMTATLRYYKPQEVIEK